LSSGTAIQLFQITLSESIMTTSHLPEQDVLILGRTSIKILSAIHLSGGLTTDQMEAVGTSLALGSPVINRLFVMANKVVESDECVILPSSINVDLNVANNPEFTKGVERAIEEVKRSAKAASVSTYGYVIDESLTDFNDIKSGSVVAIIDEVAVIFGKNSDLHYKYVLSALCDAVSEYFAYAENCVDDEVNIG
jgi:hypothetical protein